jgi:hypothetical protein
MLLPFNDKIICDLSREFYPAFHVRSLASLDGIRVAIDEELRALISLARCRIVSAITPCAWARGNSSRGARGSKRWNELACD